MGSAWRVYLTDATTGEELACGEWSATGAFVGGRQGTAADVVFRPVGDTPKDIGEQAFQGEYGFPPYCRCVRAEHFPGRTVRVKVWSPGGTRDVRVLA